jgi:hypothetical protein
MHSLPYAEISMFGLMHKVIYSYFTCLCYCTIRYHSDEEHERCYCLINDKCVLFCESYSWLGCNYTCSFNKIFLGWYRLWPEKILFYFTPWNLQDMYTMLHPIYTVLHPIYTRLHPIYIMLHPIYTVLHPIYTMLHPIYTVVHPIILLSLPWEFQILQE